MGRRRKGGPLRNPGPPRADARVGRWLRGAFDARCARDPREAEKLARRVLHAVPEQPDAMHLLATVARETGRTDLAIGLYRRLLRRHPAIPIAHNSLGNLLQERDRWQEAVACYGAALALDPRYASAYFNLGRALLHTNDLVRAEHCLRQAAALAPGDAQVRARLARAMVAHVGLEWDDACLRPHEVARTVRTASAWQVRQPVYRRSAGRAQRYERFLGPLREALGELAPGG